MSTLWISRMCAYKHTTASLSSAEQIILHKVRRQCDLFHIRMLSIPKFQTTRDVLIYEAHSAKRYWKYFFSCIPSWAHCKRRDARSDDIANRLLNIGYHHLNSFVSRILLMHNVSPAIAILHSAKTEKSKPLVYDLMELFRVDVVDKEVLRFLRMKKKPLLGIHQKDIGIFLKRVNARLERKIYIKKFKQCHTYKYFIELQVLAFMKAVREQIVFRPIVLPKRNESRCP